MLEGQINQFERRPPFAAAKGIGEDACVIGPDDEVVVEIGDARAFGGQLNVALIVADALNDHSDNHECNAMARRDRAKHLLLLVRENVIGDVATMEFLADVIGEAGAQFSRAEIAELTGSNVPF